MSETQPLQSPREPQTEPGKVTDLQPQPFDLGNFSELFEQLNAEQQIACVAFSVSSWQSGIEEEAITAMECSMVTVRELIQMGLVQVELDREFVNEYLREHEAEYQRVQGKLENRFPQFTDEDRKFLFEYERHQSLSKNKQTKPRYRLYSEKFHDYVGTVPDDELKAY